MWDSPLGRVFREPEGHTRNDPSRGARGEEHPIGPPWRGVTPPRETHVFPNPGPLEGPGSLWKLPQSVRKPDRDMISTRAKIPPEFYPGNLKNLGLSPEILILCKSLNLGSLGDFLASARDGRGSSSSGRVVRDAGQGPLEASA